MPNQVVILDGDSLKEISRVITGAGPDGIAWDPVHKVVGVSDQRDGALSILTDSGQGARTQVPLGTETGNVVFDSKRSLFWITVVRAQGPDALVAIDPTTASITAQLELPGCNGAHGLRLHPNGNSALIACEGNSLLARVELEGAHTLVTARVGDGPDVLAVDSGLQRLYVAAEAGDVNVFDLSQPGLALINSQRIGDNAHSVGVDSATHRVFFPLAAGSQGKPTLRIMRPSGP